MCFFSSVAAAEFGENDDGSSQDAIPLSRMSRRIRQKEKTTNRSWNGFWWYAVMRTVSSFLQTVSRSKNEKRSETCSGGNASTLPSPPPLLPRRLAPL